MEKTPRITWWCMLLLALLATAEAYVPPKQTSSRPNSHTHTSSLMSKKKVTAGAAAAGKGFDDDTDSGSFTKSKLQQDMEAKQASLLANLGLDNYEDGAHTGAELRKHRKDSSKLQRKKEAKKAKLVERKRAREEGGDDGNKRRGGARTMTREELATAIWDDLCARAPYLLPEYMGFRLVIEDEDEDDDDDDDDCNGGYDSSGSGHGEMLEKGSAAAVARRLIVDAVGDDDGYMRVLRVFAASGKGSLFTEEGDGGGDSGGDAFFVFCLAAYYTLVDCGFAPAPSAAGGSGGYNYSPDGGAGADYSGDTLEAYLLRDAWQSNYNDVSSDNHHVSSRDSGCGGSGPHYPPHRGTGGYNYPPEAGGRGFETRITDQYRLLTTALSFWDSTLSIDSPDPLTNVVASSSSSSSSSRSGGSKCSTHMVRFSCGDSGSTSSSRVDSGPVSVTMHDAAGVAVLASALRELSSSSSSSSSSGGGGGARYPPGGSVGGYNYPPSGGVGGAYGDCLLRIQAEGTRQATLFQRLCGVVMTRGEADATRAVPALLKLATIMVASANNVETAMYNGTYDNSDGEEDGEEVTRRTCMLLPSSSPLSVQFDIARSICSACGIQTISGSGSGSGSGKGKGKGKGTVRHVLGNCGASLLRSADFRLPASPFLDGAGRVLQSHPALSNEDRMRVIGETLKALVSAAKSSSSSWDRLGMCRLLAGVHSAGKPLEQMIMAQKGVDKATKQAWRALCGPDGGGVNGDRIGMEMMADGGMLSRALAMSHADFLSHLLLRVRHELSRS